MLRTSHVRERHASAHHFDPKPNIVPVAELMMQPTSARLFFTDRRVVAGHDALHARQGHDARLRDGAAQRFV
jgi:hypothetical protein